MAKKRLTSKKWLLEKAALENKSFVSAGGFVNEKEPHKKIEKSIGIRDSHEIEAACERAAIIQNKCANRGKSQYFGMTYEDGLRDAFDWVCRNVDEDPTLG